MSSSGGIGSTLTGGIQDIAGILPLLGTAQCAIHVSSALTRGYLYAASAPMSIFSSLGVVSAGFKTMVACFSYGDIEGAKVLGNMGFEPQGENLSLIMVEGGKGENKGRYIIENRIDELIEALNVDKNRITGVSHKSAPWNIKMMLTTALLCALGITPYIYINLLANKLDLKRGTIWVFPILRSTGGFITTVLIQLLIQRRITAISDEYLVKRDQQPVGNGDVEAAAGVEKKNYQMDARTWSLLFFLLIGLLASVVGYVGCFSIVQNSASTFGPVSWLCLEAGLSLIRLAIWAWNPTRDDAPPLEINLKLDKYEPLPTCNKDNAEILEYKVLPLTRARDFLKTITSFVGLIKPFSIPDTSLYYTLTRKRRLFWNSENVGKYELGERTLYITVFDHKERTTRVYTRDYGNDTLYSTKSDAPLVDVGHFILEVEINDKIDSNGDPVCSDSYILSSLREHHQSILDHIQYRLAGDVTETYAIKNSWTMKAENTISTLQREGNGEVVVEKRREEQRNEELLISDYFMHLSTERERGLLDDTRIKWIARRMDMITKEMKERLLGTGVEYRVNMQEVEKKPSTKWLEEVKEMLGQERYYMEVLLAWEAREWEKLFWNKFKAFLDQIDKDRLGVEAKERLTREWKANCWGRLNSQRLASLERMADVDVEDKDRLQKKIEELGEYWELFINLVFGGFQVEAFEDINISLLSKMRGWMGDGDGDEDEEMVEGRLRIEKEIDDIKFRLKRGSDLGRFDQFWDDDLLFECRYSRSKWLHFNRGANRGGFGLLNNGIISPLDVYSHALKGNKDIIHITFNNMDSNFDVNQFLCDLPWVTSITLDRPVSAPAVHSDLLFIKSSTNKDLKTFAKEIKLDPSSTYIFSDAAFYAVFSGKLGSNGRVLISFIPPTSGKTLTLRVKHSQSGEKHVPLEVTLGSTKIQLKPSSKSSLTIDDITLYPIEVSGPSDSDHLSFVPEVRNDIFIRFIEPSEWFDHPLHDIELLDEAGLEYMPHSASLSNTV